MDRRPEDLLPLSPAVLHIMLALAEGEKHGYAIMREADTLSGGAVRLGPGTLYRSIQRMLEQDLLEEIHERPPKAKDDERRRYYRITPFGEAVARAEASRLTDLVKLARASGLVPRRA